MTTLSWIWPSSDGVNGVRIDPDKKLLHWYDAVGCACDDSTADQSLIDYQRHGVPGLIELPPTDVQAEIEQTLATLKNTAVS